MLTIKTIKLFTMLLTMFALVLILDNSSSYANTIDYLKAPIVDVSEDNNIYPAESNGSSEISPYYVNNYEYKIVSKQLVGRQWGNFRNGPTGRGPASLSINESLTLNRSVTNTISGDFPIGKGNIAKSLGVTV